MRCATAANPAASHESPELAVTVARRSIVGGAASPTRQRPWTSRNANGHTAVRGHSSIPRRGSHALSIIFNYRQCATAPAKDRKVIWNRQGDGLSHAFSLVGNTLVRLSGSLAGRLHSSCKDSRTEVRSRRRESISSRMSVQDTQRLVEQGGLKLVRVVDLPGAGQSSAEQARTEPSGDTRGSGLRSCARAA
jgi:hypothetical protein